jgi:hypothetical protein
MRSLNGQNTWARLQYMAMDGTVLLCTVNAGKISLKGIAVDPRSTPKGRRRYRTPQTPSAVAPKSNHDNVQTCNGTHERLSHNLWFWGGNVACPRAVPNRAEFNW